MAGVKGRRNGETLPRHPSGKFTEAFLDQYREDRYHQNILAEIGLALSNEDGPGYFRKDEILKKAGVLVDFANAIRWDVLELLVEDSWGESLTPLSEKFWSRKHRTKNGSFGRKSTTEEWRQSHAHECLAGCGPAKTVGYCKLTYSEGKFSLQRMKLDRLKVVGQADHYRKRRDSLADTDTINASQYKRLLEADRGFNADLLLEKD